MAAYNADLATKKQIAGVQANVASYQEGVRKNTVHPGEAAIRAKQKMINRFNEAMNGTKFEDGCRSYDLAGYQERTATVGARNLVQGVKDAEPKTRAFHDEFSTFLDGHLAKVNAMSTDTVEDRLTKMRENALGIAKFKRTRRR